MHRRVIFRLILFFIAGAVLYIIAGLGTDDLVLSHKCGPEFNYYGCEPPAQAAVAARNSPYTSVLMGLVLALGAGFFILILIGVLAFLSDRNWLSED